MEFHGILLDLPSGYLYNIANSNIGLINPPLVGQSDLLASFLDHPLIISNSEP